MVVSEHGLLVAQRLFRAVFTSPVDALLEPGPKEDVASMSELVQEVRLVSLSRVDKNVEHPWLMPEGMVEANATEARIEITAKDFIAKDFTLKQ